ncbi:hypothetical protein [uncultured Kordia sp.]|uniref:hypothetical protein n=1 Tax=uncultured Kordia sp. TaxID=507699 RepID=UPI002630C34D|nr:hypothetical protein [uncultured Kordia sp.]
MKKQHLNSLHLNKRAVSNFKSTTITGGGKIPLTIAKSCLGICYSDLCDTTD